MSLAINGKIRLLTTPKSGVSGTGSPWANALGYCPNWAKTDDGWSENGGFTCSLGAFNDAAGLLAACSKGDVIEIEGKARDVAIWAPPDRPARAQLDIRVETVTPVRTGGNDRPSRRREDRAGEDWPLPTTQAAPASSPVQPTVGTGPTVDQPTADVLDFRRGAMERLSRQHRTSRLTGSSA